MISRAKKFNRLFHNNITKLLYENMQISYLETTNKLDLTGKHQHGFKRNKSPATAGALLQSVISHAADDKCYVVIASLDLSMAFDIVDTNLLIRKSS